MKKTIALADTDLLETFARSSGPGGQNVNKIASKVILRHLPTHITVTVQDSRSQATNRQLARERLLQAIQEAERASQLAAQQAREKLRRRKAPRPRALKERILKSKQHRARIKKLRARPHQD